MAKARTYYTLAERETLDSAWGAQFGDYAKDIVQAELEDSLRFPNDKKRFKIISSGDNQKQIESAIAALNAKQGGA